MYSSHVVAIPVLGYENEGLRTISKYHFINLKAVFC